ncbi:hypothetical protein [Anaerocolumna sp. MB42-C2]|nr:hypothetical protein [Anaerocolumna sp. MB42-C2]WMJ86842.1 hypothetical protein RBU59_22830 [Anaerocolumna sp. MB42-C2]
MLRGIYLDKLLCSGGSFLWEIHRCNACLLGYHRSRITFVIDLN